MDNNTMRISSEILFAAVEEQLAAGRSASFTVTGMSMWPFLCHGRDRDEPGRPGSRRYHPGLSGAGKVYSASNHRFAGGRF